MADDENNQDNDLQENNKLMLRNRGRKGALKKKNGK